MTIQLLAIDIDGTLVNSRYELTDVTIHAIHAAQQRGVHVVLCTGRPFSGARGYMKMLGMDTQPAHIITYNGALIQRTNTLDIVSHIGVTGKQFKALTQLAEQVGVHCHALDFEAIYTVQHNMSMYTGRDAYFANMPILYRAPDELEDDKLFTKVMFIDDPAKLDAGISQIPNAFTQQYTMFKSEPFYFEILHKQASKGQALATLAEQLHIAPRDVMAIGDHPNDFDMIQYAGIGVAMGNAVPMIRDVADFLTATNDEDGVAQAIHAHILDK
ncbi:sugar-phosphatase [Caryophanon tenue]|uniref:Sugar-phosphatase n=1 Tax=Caryophanon tenue TaxID=33978 RepID=A0A1C0YC27_9BACL|nr:sugar-phosphatase [Caryophanon tenue]OCS84701.1 hypothetical protein A6M13_03755 [Caryophanon tenue]